MDPRKKRDSEPLLGSEVLQRLFENGKDPLSEQFLRWKLWRQWEQVAGPLIFKASEPVGYRRGVLYLWVKNSSWMQQLVFLKDPLKDKINRHLGMIYVQNIHLTLDRRSVPGDAESRTDLQNHIRSIVQSDE